MKTYRIAVTEHTTAYYEVEAENPQKAFDEYLLGPNFTHTSDNTLTIEDSAEIFEIDGEELENPITIDMLPTLFMQSILDKLTDLGIDLEGEDEETLAGVRMEIHDYLDKEIT